MRIIAKTLILAFCLQAALDCPAQQSDYRHPPILGLHFVKQDFKNNQPFGPFRNMNAGLGLSYLKGLGRRLDYMISISGSFPDSTAKQSAVTGKSYLLLQPGFSLRFRIIPGHSVFHPFLISGAGFSQFRKNTAVFVPLGAGIQLNYRDIYLLSSFQYRLSLSARLNNHYHYSIGIAGLLSRPKKRKPQAAHSLQTAVFPLSDRDGDGITDSLDACPETPGIAIFSGCPDRDLDGIDDRKDRCPGIPGIVKYHGCPVPDTDRDGINDEEDHCIDLPGPARYQGCPVPDTDKDGLNDEEDSCLTVPGIRENHGCPAVSRQVLENIQLTAKKIFFKTGSYLLLPRSHEALDDIFNILKAYPSLSLIIEGHTDNEGTVSSNQVLSENRARAVMNYLVSKGISVSRLSAVGYGQSRPIDSNDTPHGRANNRRVEIRLR